MTGRTVIVVEDDRMAMAYLKSMIEQYFEGDQLHFLHSITELVATTSEIGCVDVLISDLSLPDSKPIKTLKVLQQLRTKNPNIKIVISSQMTDEYLVQEIAHVIGINALYHKQLDTSKLEGYLMGIDAMNLTSNAFESEDLEKASNLLTMSDKKFRILECLCQGMSINQIARETNRTYNSVHNHIQEIKSSVSEYKKLQHLFG
ncbi:response regulator (plasmid) [Vibrio scophthalmi]|uniref:response regulator n=1 Tax=Vibrio scophthalmi TaxID=45658 RepID=UPI003EBFBB2F